MKQKKKSRRGVAAAAFLLVAGTVYTGTPKTAEDFRIQNHIIESEQWDGRPLKAVLISDTHVGGKSMTIQDLDKIIDQINETKPDIVLGAGDYILDKLKIGKVQGYDVEAIAKSYGRLRSKYGTYVTLGNHDWRVPETKQLITAFRKYGVTVLENQAHIVNRADGSRFCVAGISDFDRSPSGSDLEQTFRDIPPNCPVLLITHNPKAFRPMTEKQADRVALMTAGHTHCGQIRGVGHLAILMGGIHEWKFHGGRFQHKAAQGFVTCGVGNSSIELRTISPVAEHITLK